MNKENMLEYPLSTLEMLKLNPDAKLIVYTDLNKIFNINDLFDDTNKVIILYLLQSKTSGHWVCLFKNNDKTGADFHYFDSYGEEEDYHLDNLTHLQRVEFNQKQDRLKILLHKYKVYYNNVRLQSKGTSTCGMFVTHRLHNYKLNEAEYINLFVKKRVSNPDLFVANYVLNLLK